MSKAGAAAAQIDTENDAISSNPLPIKLNEVCVISHFPKILNE